MPIHPESLEGVVGSYVTETTRDVAFFCLRAPARLSACPSVRLVRPPFPVRPSARLPARPPFVFDLPSSSLFPTSKQI